MLCLRKLPFERQEALVLYLGEGRAIHGNTGIFSYRDGISRIRGVPHPVLLDFHSGCMRYVG